MKTKKVNYLIYIFPILLLSVFISACSERDVDELPKATRHSTTPEVFIDGFSDGLDFIAWGKVDNFKLDYTEKYNGTASMRFDVPNSNDPNGSAAGGAFQVASGRDLSGYNVLTFWAKASQTNTLSSLGFGSSSTKGVVDETFKVTLNNLVVTTEWTKYYILIPDSKKLTQEKGMFWYWVTAGKDGKGFTFWIDDMKFEKLGTINHINAGAIFEGKDVLLDNVENGDYTIPGLSATYNLPTGENDTINFPASYLTLTSSNQTVASVNKNGTYTVTGKGSTLITAKLMDKFVKGSLLINSIGAPILPTTAANTPTVASADVISIYSDAYKNTTIDSFEPFWTWSGGGMTTNFSIYSISGNNYIRYTNFNDIYNQKRILVAISFESTPINASAMTHLHMDLWMPSSSPNSTNIPKISLEDWSGNYGGTNSTGVYTHSGALPANQWISLDIPLSSFAGLSNKAHLVHLILDNFPTVIYVDNIYLHK